MRPGVLVTRPLPQARATAERLSALGYAPVLSPMLRYEALVPPPTVDLTGVQAILLTSAHAVPGLANATEERETPILAVGDRTATAARDAGFLHVRSAEGDAVALGKLAATLIPGGGTILHVRGEHVSRSPLQYLKNFETSEIVVYRSEQAGELSSEAISALEHRRIAAILVYSPRTAEALARCLFNTETLALIGISDISLAPLAPCPFASRRYAAQPTESGLFAALTATVPAKPGL